MRRLLLPLLLLAISPACSKPEPPPSAKAPAPAPLPPSPTPPAPAAAKSPPARVPSLKREIEPWLNANCANTKNCHGFSPNMNCDLDLRPGAGFAALVGVEAERRDGKRVEPGDPERSFLVAKLLGTIKPRGEGKPMPLDPKTGRVVLPLPADPDFINGALIPWIQAGAPNN